jgi:hypothetical protein
MFNLFQQSYYIGGTWAANHTIAFKPPVNCQLVAVSLSNTTANAGTCKIGTASDDDYYLAVENFGVSSTPVVVNTPAGFDGVGAGGQYPHIEKDSVVIVTLTDHASHMANATLVLTFTEG